MASKKSIRFAGALVLMATGSSAGAVPFSSFDPRSYAMGGVGVASGTSANAVFFNPALLAAAAEDEHFSLELPIVGGRVADPGELGNAINDFNDVEPVGTFQDAVNAYQDTPNAGTAAAVQTAGDTLIEQLQNLSDKTLAAEADVAFVLGIPHRKFGISVFANVDVLGGTVGEVTDADLVAIQQTIDDALNSQPVTDPTDALTSTVSARISRITEVGVSIAREFDVLGGISVGITPKYVGVRTYDIRFVGSEIDTAEISLSESQQSDSSVNLDFGLAKDYDNGWKAGFAVRNLLAQKYTTVLGNEFKIEPMARMGVSYRNSCLVVAADLDLTENDSGGFEPKTQYVALGAEVYMFEIAQLRLGYRHNLSDVPAGVETGMITAGLGFSPFGIHADLAVASNGDELGAALQLGFRF